MTCQHFDPVGSNGAGVPSRARYPYGAGDIENRYSTAARTYSMRAAGMYRT